MDEAAINWAMNNNEESIKTNKELSSAIFYTKINNKPIISTTEPHIGTENRNSNTLEIKPNMRIIGLIHSHAAYDSFYNNNEFSDAFINEKGDVVGDKHTYRTFSLTGYVSTPAGLLLKFTPYNEETSVITNEIPSDEKDPDRCVND
jgi:hypothetical protein